MVLQILCRRRGKNNFLNLTLLLVFFYFVLFIFHKNSSNSSDTKNIEAISVSVQRKLSRSPDLPGEMGKPVILPSNVSAEIQKMIDEGWKKNKFNQYVSDLISVHRTLPDVRTQYCKDVERDYITNSLQTSVIIIFRNEAWTALLRTVHSVLERSPDHLLKEVILVDDFSDMPQMKQQLDDYMATLPKVKIVHAVERQGLIRARLLGAKHATAQVLTFMDSHIEVTTGWLEPLIDRIARNPTTVVCPKIDQIDGTTFEHQTFYTQIGGFDWKLIFRWIDIPNSEKTRRKDPSEPVRSPTMPGGFFSIDRTFFERLGWYDTGFNVWGGENLELSFKAWMCGGSLEIVPCSHAAHIFRANQVIFIKFVLSWLTRHFSLYENSLFLFKKISI
jgi:polypeptide N-acetylgalactosaminyltransferase